MFRVSSGEEGGLRSGGRGQFNSGWKYHLISPPTEFPVGGLAPSKQVVTLLGGQTLSGSRDAAGESDKL